MSKRVVIVGAGVIGLCSAYSCVRQGFDVTVVERNPNNRNGCSFGNAGLITPSHFIPLAAPGMMTLGLKWMLNPSSPFYVQPRLDPALFGWGMRFWRAANARQVRRAAPLLRDLSMVSRACFEELARLPGMDFGLVKSGLLMLCRTERALHEEVRVVEQARALGIPAEVLDATQIAALDPGVERSVLGAVHFPLDCHLSPARFMVALQGQLERSGVRFLWQSEVLDFKIDGQRRVHALETAGGDGIEADEFVVCGGAWSSELACKLGLRLPMQAGKGYSLTLKQPPELPGLCSILTEARVAVTPMGETLRVGGTMELAGLNEKINRVRVQGIIDSFCRYHPNFQPSDFAGVEPWCGLRPCSPDGLPYVGRTGKFRNLSLATGHAMLGLSLGPVTGELIAEVLSGTGPSHDISMLSPDRYNETYS